MRTVELTRREVELMEKAFRYTISTLQYEQHQARQHGCKGGCYDKEIAEFRELKKKILCT